MEERTNKEKHNERKSIQKIKRRDERKWVKGNVVPVLD
jgi:hypothetical protein